MNQINNRVFLKQSLAIAVTTLMISTVQAAPNNDEVKQLREEVKALKALILQQQQVQSQQQVQIAEVRQQPVQVAAAPAPTPEPSVLSDWKSKAGSSVNIYGFVRADANYAFKGGNGIFNRINAVDINGALVNGVNNPNKDRFYTSVNTSRLGFDFKAPVQDADVKGKFEIDVGGASNAVRIRHAYMTYNNWLLGQTTSSFLSGDTSPDMMDFGGALGIGTYRTPMVRYSDKLGPDTQYAVSVEQGRSDNRLPSLAGNIKQSFAGDKGVVTGRAMVQETRARLQEVDASGTAISGREYNDQKEFGWGLAAGAKYNFTEQLSAVVDYSHIKGDDKYLLYTDGMAYNTNPDKRSIELVEYDAVSTGLTYKFAPQWRTNLGYGAIFFDKTVSGQNDKFQQGWLNVMYNPVKPITLGAEYVYGERGLTSSDAVGRDSRLGLMAKYDF